MRRTLFILVAVPVALLVLSVAVIASTGGVASLRYHGDPNFFLLRQVVFGGLSVVLAAVLAAIDYRVWARRDVMFCLLMAVLVGLVAVFLPGIGVNVKGSHRWINLGFTRIQPSEFVKILLILLMAAWYGQVSRRQERFWEGCAIPGLVLAVVAVGFLKQPDLGSTVLAGAVSFVIMVVSGVRMVYLAGMGLAGVAAIGSIILVDPERRSRIDILFNPEALSKDDSHQVEQSLAAFQSGGLRGVGYGHSLLKERYLPESHTDFILPMAGEELGLLCSLLVVLAYVLILCAGIVTSLRAPDKFGRLMAFGMTFHLCLSAAINIAVVTRMAPTKGLALPFMSYGGSNLLASMGALGLILSVARRCGRRTPVPVCSRNFDTHAALHLSSGNLAISPEALPKT